MTDSTEPLPRQIYSLWMQGEENAPPLVRWNFERWRSLNPDFELVVLDDKTSRPYLADLPIDLADVTVQARSDIIRLSLLDQHGGIWVDASVVPLAPLDDWINHALARAAFFAFEREGITLPLSSWFLAARPGAHLVRDWNALVRSYWSVARAPLQKPGTPLFVPEDPMAVMEPFSPETAKPYPYFWLHHLFGVLLHRDANFAELWANRYRLSSKDAHLYADHFYKQTKPRKPLKALAFHLQRRLGLQKDLALKEIASGTPLQKLDWRSSYPDAAFDGFQTRPDTG